MILLKKTLLFGILIFTLASCNEKTNIKDYYFPYDKLEEEGMVYEYRSAGEIPMPTIYWYYYGSREGRTKYLNGIYAEADFIPRQIIREEYIKSGVLLEEVSLSLVDSSGTMTKNTGEILAANVFPYNVTEDGGIFLYKVKFEFPDEGGNSATLIKNRKFTGDSTIIFDNIMYDCIKFDVKELVEYGNDQEGYTEPPFSGIEYYAKSIGLVHYIKQTEKGPFMEYSLHKRYPLKEADTFLREELFKLGIK
jgi:hypothetical protein